VAAFVDTNVIVYAFDAGDERKRALALELLDDPSLAMVVSSQVLTEFYWTVTRKLVPPLPEEAAQDVVHNLAQGEVVAVDASLVEAAIALARRHRLSLWDAAIVAAAQRAGCSEILSEDLHHGGVVAGIRIRNPFAA
jgi:predicted nucleic acid-binding protein